MNTSVDNVRCILLPNPFDLSEREETSLVHRPVLADYLEGVDARFFTASVNGHYVPAELWAGYTIRANDEIVLKTVVHGESGKTVLRMVAMIAVMVVAIMIVPWATPTLGKFWATVLGASIAVTGGALLSWLGRPRIKTEEDSPNYSWSGPMLTSRQGLVIQKGYGTLQVAPNVVSSYLQSYRDQQHMNLLLSFGHGPVRAIRDLKINDNPIENFKNVVVEKRLGFQDQAPISFFNDIINEYAQNQKIVSGSSHTVMGQRTDTQALEVEVAFPQGLWTGPDNKGNYGFRYVHWKVEYRKVGDGSFTTALRPRVTSPVGSTPRWLAVPRDHRSGGEDPILVVGTSNNDDHYEGQTFCEEILQPVYHPSGSFEGNVTRKLCYYWTENPEHPGNVGGTPGNYQLVQNWVSGTKSTGNNKPGQIIRDTFRIDNLEPGQYEIRVTKVGASSTFNGAPSAGTENDPKTGEEMWLTSIREIAYDDLSYPGIALVGVRALATDQLSGSSLNVTAVVEYGEPETLGYKHTVAVDLPQLYYRFDETSGTTAFDSSGYGRDGVYTGTWTKAAPGLLKDSPSKSAQPEYSVNAYIQLNQVLTLGGGDYALEGWYRWAGVSDFYVEFVRSSDGNHVFGIGTDRRPFLKVAGTTYQADTILPSNTEPHYVAVSVREGAIRFIVNGVLDTASFSNGATVSFGRIGYSSNGLLDEVAAYRPSPQPARFRAHYLRGVHSNRLEDFTSDNPACVAWDILTNPTYAGATPYSLLDSRDFVAWAERCNHVLPSGEYRYSFNGVFDERTSVWDALSDVGAISGAAVVRTGAKYGVVLDAPSTPVQHFNVSNILKDSFKQNWLPRQDRANSIDITYYDEADDFQRTVLTVELSEEIAAGAPIVKAAAIDGRGVTSRSHAYRLGRQALLKNQKLHLVVEFEAAIEAIAHRVGDVISVSHELPGWSVGGRTRSNPNLLVSTETFESADWIKDAINSGTAPTVTANVGSSPNGSVTADRVAFPATSGSQHSRMRQEYVSRIPAGTPSGTSLTGSIWVKLEGGSHVGTTSLVLEGTGGPNATVSIIPTTSWQRFQVSGATTSSTPSSARLMLRRTGTSDAINLQVWGAQVNLGSSAVEYVPGGAVRLDQPVTMGAGEYRLLVAQPSILRHTNNISAIQGNRVTVTGWTNPHAIGRLKTGSLDLKVVEQDGNWVELEELPASVQVGHSAQLYTLDLLETRVVSYVSGFEFDTVLTQSAFTVQPDGFLPYAFYRVDDAPRKFRVFDLGRTSEYMRRIAALEYSDDVYPDDEPPIDSNVTGDVSEMRKVVDLQVEEEPTGPTSTQIRASWKRGPRTAGAQVYVATKPAGDSDFAPEKYEGETESTFFTFPAQTGDTYQVRVVGYDSSYRRAPYQTSPVAEILADGYTPKGVHSFNNTDHIHSLPVPTSPTGTPTVPSSWGQLGVDGDVKDRVYLDMLLPRID